MPRIQKELGEISGSSGMPCANSLGARREAPDVSADGDAYTGGAWSTAHKKEKPAGSASAVGERRQPCGPMRWSTSPRLASFRGPLHAFREPFLAVRE
jgi:hypothetical protein